MNVLSFFKLTKRHVFNLNCISPKIYGAFSLFIFCSLILGFTNRAKSKKIRTMKNTFIQTKLKLY